jgi:pimeloyl-ACP methyl ester carboxylesterase
LRRSDLTVAGVGVSLYTAGDEHGSPAVVFLHGGGLMGATWGRVCDRLSSRWRCIAPDLRGHGDTEWTTDGAYSLPGFADDLRDLLAHLHLERPHVVGMSLGGQTALHAICHGLEVASLVLVDIGPRVVQGGGDEIRSFLGEPSYDTFQDALSAARRLHPRRSVASLEGSLRRSMRPDEQGRWTWKWDPRRGETRAERVREARELWPLLPQVTCPTLVVRGGVSPLFSEALATDLVHELPDARLVTVEGAGHAVQTDAPDELAQILEDFLGSH